MLVRYPDRPGASSGGDLAVSRYVIGLGKPRHCKYSMVFQSRSQLESFVVPNCKEERSKSSLLHRPRKSIFSGKSWKKGGTSCNRSKKECIRKGSKTPFCDTADVQAL